MSHDLLVQMAYAVVQPLPTNNLYFMLEHCSFSGGFSWINWIGGLTHLSIKRFEISIILGGISLLSSSLMPYRTLLTSCDDMNIFLVPLYQPHAGKTGKQLRSVLQAKIGCSWSRKLTNLLLWSTSLYLVQKGFCGRQRLYEITLLNKNCISTFTYTHSFSDHQ